MHLKMFNSPLSSLLSNLISSEAPTLPISIESLSCIPKLLRKWQSSIFAELAVRNIAAAPSVELHCSNAHFEIVVFELEERDIKMAVSMHLKNWQFEIIISLLYSFFVSL